MASLVADIHEADAIVTIERESYRTDSQKTALRDAVFARHGITEEQFDTSLVWYGHNLDIYSEVYEEAIDILKDVEGISIVRMNEKDIVRHKLVTRIVKAYKEADKARPAEADGMRTDGKEENQTR